MKQKIAGPAAIGIIVVVTIALVGFLYTRFIQDKTVSPEDTRKAMMHSGGH